MKYRFSFLLVFVSLIFLVGCSPLPVIIQGSAMRPTLNDGDKVLMDKNLGELKRGDIINFLYPKDKSKQYIKRIVGLPNEKVEIKNGEIFINDKQLDEPYVNQEFNQSKQTTPAQIVPENQYFVLGDNRDNSSDSRVWGTLPKDLIVGKYYMTYSKAGK